MRIQPSSAAALSFWVWVATASWWVGGLCFAGDEPDVVELNRRGAHLFATQRPREAAQQFRRSLELDPNQPTVVKVLGLSYQLANEDEHAEQAFVTASKLAPKDSEPWFYLGRLYYNQNFFGKALLALRRSIELDPRDYQSHHYLGLTLEAEGDRDRAIEQYKEAIKWNAKQEKPNFAPHLSYGVLLSKLKLDADSERQLLRARELDPTVWQSYFELGKLYYRQGKLEAAERELWIGIQSGRASGDDAARVYYLLARVYFAMGCEEEAQRMLKVRESLLQ